MPRPASSNWPRAENGKIPLTYRWVPDEFLNDHLLVDLAKGDDATRKVPALVFAFNRDECWSIAEQLKGLDLLNTAQKETALQKEVDQSRLVARASGPN